jgi:hypothetical protein
MTVFEQLDEGDRATLSPALGDDAESSPVLPHGLLRLLVNEEMSLSREGSVSGQ